MDLHEPFSAADNPPRRRLLWLTLTSSNLLPPVWKCSRKKTTHNVMTHIHGCLYLSDIFPSFIPIIWLLSASDMCLWSIMLQAKHDPMDNDTTHGDIWACRSCHRDGYLTRCVIAKCTGFEFGSLIYDMAIHLVLLQIFPSVYIRIMMLIRAYMEFEPTIRWSWIA